MGQLKKLNAEDNAIYAWDNDQFMFVLIVLEEIKETRLKSSQESATVL